MKSRANLSLHRSVQCAFQGLTHMLREERNARLHLLAAVLVIALSAWLGIGPLEWCLVIVAITLVFVGEMINTSVERLVDLNSPTLHPLAGQAKDVAAAAVLFSAAAAIVIGVVVLGPPLVQKVSALFCRYH